MFCFAMNRELRETLGDFETFQAASSCILRKGVCFPVSLGMLCFPNGTGEGTLVGMVVGQTRQWILGTLLTSTRTLAEETSVAS